MKNNKEIKIDPQKISFEKENLTIKKEEEDYIIKLDFKENKCTIYLKKENITSEINVIEMNYKNDKNKFIFCYELISEINTKNKIIITS